MSWWVDSYAVLNGLGWNQ